MNMKFLRLDFFIMAFAALAAWTPPVQASKVRIVTTLTDLADFAREIGKDHVQVHSLATGVEDTHGVPMKPNFVPLLNRADMVILVGFDCETLPAGAPGGDKNPGIQQGRQGYVDCSRGISFRWTFPGAPITRRGRAPVRQSPLHARSGPGKDGRQGNLRGPRRLRSKG